MANFSSSLSRRVWFWFAVGGVARVAVLLLLGIDERDDRDGYLALARQVVAGRGLVDPEQHSPTAFRPPLYPYVLAAVLTMGGSVLACGFVQASLGAVTVALAYRLGRRLGLGRGADLAAACVALDPILLQNTTLFMTETLATCLVTAAIVALDMSRTEQAAPGDLTPLALRSERNTGSLIPSWTMIWGSLLAGLCAGLCCLCRPTFLPWCGLIACIGLAVGMIRGWPFDVWRWGAWGLGVVLCLAPWAARNWHQLGRPVITTTHGGYTLLLGHNRVYYREVVEQPWGAVWPGPSLLAWQAELERSMAQEIPPIDRGHWSTATELSRDAWMYRQAWSTIREDPLLAARSGLTLIGRLWNVRPLVAHPAGQGWVRRVIAGYYLVGFALALVGLLRLSRTDWRRWWPWLLLPAIFTAVHFIYWADMRMRAPLVPVLAWLMGYAVSRRREGASPPAKA